MADIIRNRRVRPEMTSEAAASGWGELHKHVRTTDTNKVDDCRDDIDTLLVFAGLYSAVLTAFVIESYTHLQQDTQDAIVGLLQQLVAKNFTSGPGYMNSTNPSPQLPPFEPPVWAIRVNVLWFTSLLLSLASASFGILVKQWLREYLAIDYAAPRERLRARQYRYPAMEDWKVFEIAAFLPLLLQLSLGLFFIGLCFFTAAVHQSISQTTAPLVCAWVFLLFMMTIAPLFSPRCPFKTTFLKKAFRIGRRYTAPSFYDFTSSILRVVRTILRAVRRRILAAQRAVYLRWVGLRALTRREIRRTPLKGDVDAGDESKLGNEPAEDSDGGAPEEEYIAAKENALLEEDEVVEGEEEDADILLSVDSLVSDDGLLLPMLDAFRQQSGLTPAKIIAFVLQIIGHRIGQDLGEKRITRTLDLAVLSKHAWTVLTDAIVDALLLRRAGPLQSDRANSDCLFNAITILHSSSGRQLSEHASSTLQEVAVTPRRAFGHSCSGGVHLYRHLPHHVEATPAVPSLDSKETVLCLRCVTDVYTTLLYPPPARPPLSLRHLLDERIFYSSGSFLASSKTLLQDLIGVLMSVLLGTISLQKDPAEIPGSHEALHIILQYGETFEKHDDAVKLCHQMLLSESGTRMLLIQFVALHPQYRVDVNIPEILRGVLWSTSLEGKLPSDTVTLTITTACKQFYDGDGDVQLDYVRLCAMFVRWMWNDQAAKALAKAIKKYHRTRGWRKELQRRDYWHSDVQSPTSAELFKVDQDLACEIPGIYYFHPELANALWLFVPEERSEEVLRSIRQYRPDYMPPAPSTGLEDSENGQGRTSMGTEGQEVGDAGQEGPEGMDQDAGRGDALDMATSGGADVDAIDVPTGDERSEGKDAAEHKTVEEGTAADGGDSAGKGVAQVKSPLAEEPV